MSESTTVAAALRGLEVDTKLLQVIEDAMIREMDRGLNGEPSSIRMLPSFVDRLPTGQEKGSFLALDLGGTNYRVCRVVLAGDGSIASFDKDSYQLTEKELAGDASDLFDALARSVESFLFKRVGQEETYGTEHALGFTFSFPTQQLSLNNGELIAWTKGFSTKGVEGKNVVELLQGALQRRKLSVHVSALVNDTVGTLMAFRYHDNDAGIGLILGTGTNATYVEKSEKVLKMPEEQKQTDIMVINMEWGAFDGEKDGVNTLPRVRADEIIDEMSPNKGQQWFEKMISGMYLGELVRLHLVELREAANVLPDTNKSGLQANCIQTAHLSAIDAGAMNDEDIKQLLAQACNTTTQNIRDSDVVVCRSLSQAVTRRAARLCAAGLAAVLTRTDCHRIAVDGSLFSKHEHFPQWIMEALREVKTDEQMQGIRLVGQSDGSSVGAAITSAAMQAQ